MHAFRFVALLLVIAALSVPTWAQEKPKTNPPVKPKDPPVKPKDPTAKPPPPKPETAPPPPKTDAPAPKTDAPSPKTGAPSSKPDDLSPKPSVTTASPTNATDTEPPISTGLYVGAGIVVFVVVVASALVCVHLHRVEPMREERRRFVIEATQLAKPEYYTRQKPLKCTAVQPQLTKFKEGVITFNKPEIDRLSLKCSIRPVIKGTQDNEAEYGQKIELDLTKLQEYALEDEFVEVNCDTTGVLSRNVYKYHYHHLQAKSLNVAGDDILPATLEHPPVIMLGLDSMSYGNFRRQMPLTYKRMQEMGFQDLPSHVKIGDNTYANWLAILTGKRGSAVKEFPGELPNEWHIWFDDFPFVWKNFTKNGYVTMFAEDRPDIGTFNYFGELNGFKTAPTDHYFRSYWLAAFWSLVGRRSKPFCYDARPKHEIQLDYLENFLHSYRGQRHFAYWWTQDMSHDYLNAIGQTDNSYATFLKRNSPLLDDAITIVFSDHGNRYDSIRETVVGRLEARLPFLSIRLPKNIREKYPHIAEALKTNAGRMTTQFDMYDTLLAVATGTYMNISTKTGRSYPLWHPVPETRICHEAHVPEDYCPCFNEMPIPVEEARGAAETFIAYLNKLLTAHNATKPQGTVTEPVKNYKCQILELANITYASVRLPPAKIVDDPQTGGQLPKDGIEIFYRIVIEAAPPSRALIEGLLVKRMNSKYTSRRAKSSGITSTVTRQTDNSYATFLKRNSPLLDDAITIVFSDHGNRYDSIRETVVGRLEARLPFLSIRLPKNIREKYPHIAEALKTNAGRMTTQFDMYDTLLAVATGTYMNISTKTGRSYPLWHPVPETRICHEAHVPEDYCPCFNEMPIPVEEARGAAETFIAYLNKLLTAHNATKPQGTVTEPVKNYKCQILELANITYASVRLPPAKIVDDPQTGGQLPKDGIEIFYRIVIEAAPPSRALIEGLLVKRMNSEVYVPTGEVERNNKYGHTSHCVADRTLKKICHCLEVL
ncbi:unnamed protein product, partial [Mesorhabditis spiculigera]